MQQKSGYKFYILLLVVFFLVGLFFTYNKIVSEVGLISPLPPSLTVLVNNQVSTLNLWTPIFEFFEPLTNAQEKPVISAKSALVYDLIDQKVLYAKNPEEELPLASITKIMTAIVALESGKEDDEYMITSGYLVGENSMGLTEGEVISLKDLLYGLILPSGNDAAETLAGNFPGGREKFIEAMNNKAKSLGLKNTNFTNPSGLEGDGNQYTTAYDLLVITNYAMKISLFREVVKTVNYHIPYSFEHKEFYLTNETNLLTSYPGVFGVKTGFTPEAGFCLVTYLDFKGHELIGVILGSENRREEMKELLDYSLKIQGITPPPHL